MSIDALIKLYIGQGLRQDLAQHFANHLLDLTAQILACHGQSPEQVEAILHEIRSGTTIRDA
jgi:pyrroline-5-carboxylate reductase